MRYNKWEKKNKPSCKHWQGVKQFFFFFNIIINNCQVLTASMESLVKSDSYVLFSHFIYGLESQYSVFIINILNMELQYNFHYM